MSYNPPPEQPPRSSGYGEVPAQQPPIYGGGYGMAPPNPAAGYGGYVSPNVADFVVPPLTTAPPAGRVGRGARRFGLSMLVRLAILGVLLGGGGILYSTGILSHVSAPDYPGGTKSALTADGKKMADSLYQDNNADTSHVKVFYTTDDWATVGSFYKSKLTADGWTATDTQGGQEGVIAVYDKESQETVVLAGPSALHWVANAPDSSTSIILLIGDKTK